MSQVFHRPAIGKFTALEEPKARESLLTPTMRRSASKASLKSGDGDASSVPPASASAPADLSVPAPEKEVSPAAFSPMPTMFEAAANAAAAFMERTPFAIDDAKDDDEESDEESEGVEDDVMDEVRSALLVA